MGEMVVQLLTLAVWIGSIVFFSFAVAPTVFKTLKPEDAATLIRRIFSKYYLIGIVCAAVGHRVRRAAAGGSVVCQVAGDPDFVVAGGNGRDGSLVASGCHAAHERAARTRAAAESSGKPPDEELETEWKALHRLSVQMNGVVLLCGLVLVFLIVYSRVV
jgi:hypothetical protein